MTLIEVTESAITAGTLVTVAGEFDLATAGDVQTRLEQALDHAEGLLVVEISGVTFLDSTGLRVLADAHEKGTGRGVEVVLAAPTAHVARLLNMTGLDTLFRVAASVSEAQSD